MKFLGVKGYMKDGPRTRGDRKWMMLGLVVSAFHTVSPHAQSVTGHPEQLAGAWEMATPSRVDGIFLLIYKNAGHETIQVRVYHRGAGSESGGWYLVSPVRDTAGVRFDGTNLQVLGLTAKFDPDAAHWTGEWLFDNGQRRKVVLERPSLPQGSTPSPLSGVWENVPDTTRPQWTSATSVRIHIVQSADAVLTAWMDIVSAIVPQRVESETAGRSMEVESADPTNVVLQNLSPTFSVLGRFNGVLSDDGNSLTGTWNGRAPMSLRRIR